MLFGAAEVEAAAVGATIHHGCAGEAHEFAAACDGFVDGFVRFEFAAGLVDVAEFDCFADGEGAGERFELACDKFEEGGLTRAIGSDHADNSAAGKVEVEIVIKDAIAKAHLDMFGADDEVAEARAWRDADDEIIFAR